MTIKPDRGYTILWFGLLLSFPLTVYFAKAYPELICMAVGIVALLLVTFTKSFSVYTLDENGITQKCFFFTRWFAWESFKYIGLQKYTKGGKMTTSYGLFIRCSTVSLPKSMTTKELEKKTYWAPSKTITIPFPDKGGDEMYRKFLSYCGGERDIRE